MRQERRSEIRKGGSFRKIRQKIGDAASDRADAFCGNFALIDMKRFPDHGKIGIEENRSVMQHSPAADILGVTGEFFPVYRHIIPAVDFRMDAQFCQRSDNRLAEEAQIQIFEITGIGNEAVVQIPEIVIDGASAGKPPDYTDIMLLHVRQVDFRESVLVFADDNGIVILPEHEIISVFRQIFKNILLRSQIERRIRSCQIDVPEHRDLSPKKRGALPRLV